MGDQHPQLRHSDHVDDADPDLKRNDWRTADKKKVKNIDLWLRIDAAAKPHKVEWFWVKGHAGHVENERADALARKGLEEGRAAARRPAPSIATED